MFLAGAQGLTVFIVSLFIVTMVTVVTVTILPLINGFLFKFSGELLNNLLFKCGINSVMTIEAFPAYKYKPVFFTLHPISRRLLQQPILQLLPVHPAEVRHTLLA
jgi:hypothetical protein